MSQLIKLTVRPEQTIRFPNECAHCGRAAAERMPSQLKIGGTTQSVEVPVCAECAKTLRRRSAAEERHRSQAGLTAAMAFVVIVALATFLPLDWWLKLALGVAIGAAAALLVLRSFGKGAAAKMLPEKQAILSSVRLTDFTWRDMTLEVARDDYAERLRRLNADLVIETAPAFSATPAAAASAEEQG